MQGQAPPHRSPVASSCKRGGVSATLLRTRCNECWGVQDREKRANACFGAAGCYAVTLALSGVCWIRISPPLTLAYAPPPPPRNSVACELGAAFGVGGRQTVSKLCGVFRWEAASEGGGADGISGSRQRDAGVRLVRGWGVGGRQRQKQGAALNACVCLREGRVALALQLFPGYLQGRSTLACRVNITGVPHS